jgi:hypothetical protein
MAFRNTAPPDSPVISLIRNVWTNAHRDSWQALNGALHAALMIAIRSGYKFEPGDFQMMARSPQHLDGGFNGGHWMVNEERFYSVACGSERGSFNLSAAISYETWQDRTPFLLSQPGVKSKLRLAVGIEFRWSDGQRYKVSSFPSGNEYLNALSLEWDDEPQRRVKITHAAIKAFNASLKPAKEAK